MKFRRCRKGTSVVRRMADGFVDATLLANDRRDARAEKGALT